jgi:hypothetical protein
VARIEQHVDLDEVVVPGRVHIEDMGGGYWHVSLGGGDLAVSVGPRGVTVVDCSDRVRGRAEIGRSAGSRGALDIVREQPECVRDVTLYYPDPSRKR